MRWLDTLSGKAFVWLAAALVPTGTLPVGACGCAAGKPAAQRPPAGARSPADRESLQTGPQGVVPEAGCPHCRPRAEATDSCCREEAGASLSESARPTSCPCGGGPGCTCGPVCTCGGSHRHDPLPPSTGDSVKAKDLAGPPVLAVACSAGREVRLLASCHSWHFSSSVPTPLERLSTLCRFLI